MKKLITLLAIVGFVPCVHAAEGADFSHSGDYRLKYTDSINKDFDKSSSITAGSSDPQVFEQRLKLGTDVRAGEKLSSHFTFVHNATWGENPTQVPDTQDGATGKNLLLVNEAYMTWMASDAWMLRAGRGSFTMADGSVISANDYEAVSNAFDGVMASYDHEMARISAFGVKGGATSVVNDDRIFANFWGLSVDFKSLPSFLKALNVHYMMVKQDEGTYITGLLSPNEDSSRMGVTASGDMAGFDYKLTYAAWSGERKENTTATKQDISSNMMDAHLGYSLPSMMNSNFHFGYHSDTGTKAGGTKDETYQGFYYDQHYNAGLMDVVSWGNLTYMTFGASFHPSDDITVGADMYTFTQTEKSDSSFSGSGKAVDATAGFTTVGAMAGTDTAKDAIGTELDLTVSKKYTNNFNISARYGTFSPGDEFKANGGQDTYTQMSVAANLKF